MYTPRCVYQCVFRLGFIPRTPSFSDIIAAINSRSLSVDNCSNVYFLVIPLPLGVPSNHPCVCPKLFLSPYLKNEWLNVYRIYKELSLQQVGELFGLEIKVQCLKSIFLLVFEGYSVVTRRTRLVGGRGIPSPTCIIRTSAFLRC